MSRAESLGRVTDDPPPALEAARARRRELLRAMKDIEEALAAPAPGRERAWRGAVAHRFIALRDAFEQHVNVTERPGGLFEEILRDAPRLSHQVERLRREHDQIRSTLEEILEHLSRPPEAALATERIRDVVLGLVVRIARHRQLGADLVWEAYWVDIGGESSGASG